MPPRDLTLRQFYTALARNGMRFTGWLKFVDLGSTVPIDQRCIPCPEQPTRRATLASLLHERERIERGM